MRCSKMKKVVKKALAAVLLMGICFGDTAEVWATDTKSMPVNSQQGYDVVFCLDNSGSMKSKMKARDEAARCIANMAVGSDIRIGGVYFAEDACKTQSLVSMDNEENSRKVIDDFLHLTVQEEGNKGTNIGVALEAARQLFEDQDSGNKKIIILLSDGINENEEKSRTFKKSADAKTKREAEILAEDENTEIYCVYIHKRREDEEFLKDIVNFFDDDNDYADERFRSIDESEINALSDEFAEIFFSMQNDMKSVEVSLDSSGSKTYYVPSVGVNRLQLYLRNEQAYQVNFSHETDKDVEIQKWKDDHNTFITVDNPPVGYWTLEVLGGDAANTTGRIAYYTDIRSDVTYTKNGEMVDNLYKNNTVKIVPHFYDANDNEIAVDTEADVEVTFVKCTQEGEEKIALNVDNAGGTCATEEFTIDDYNRYYVKTNISYDDFVDLSFTTKEKEITENPPTGYNQTGKFYSEKNGDSEVFYLDKSQICLDPEGEEVKLVEIKQRLENNTVEVLEEDDTLKIACDQTGKVNFIVVLQDAEGLETEVTVEGKVVNKTMESMIVGVGIGVIICLLLLAFLSTYKKKQAKKLVLQKKESLLIDIKKVLGTVDNSKYNETAKIIQEMEASIDKLKILCDNEQHPLYLEQMEEYGIANYVNCKETDDLPVIKEWKELCKSIGIGYEKLQEMFASIVELKEDKKEDRDTLDKMNYEFEDLKKIINYSMESMRKLKNKFKKITEYIDVAYKHIEKMLATPIKCNLYLEWRKDNIDYAGAKSCRNGKLKGFYPIDEVILQSYEETTTIKEKLMNDSTGIYVYGYQSEDGTVGLEIRGNKEFECYEEADTGEREWVKRAVLYKGRRYCLSTEYTARINLEIE